MGVLGITPFLQKICPHVFTKLPDRLRSLRGKTVVFDGTLVTQRLHFAPMPHPYRHIIGWHRILTELKDSDVRAICVFDGKERTAAKAREAERRRESRKVDAVRGSIEGNRLLRLQKLMRLLPYYRSLNITDRQRINDVLSCIRSTHGSLDAHVSGSTLLAPTPLPPHPPPLCGTSQSGRNLSPSLHPHFLPHPGIGLQDLRDVLDSVAVSPSTFRSEFHYMPPSVQLGDTTNATTDNELSPCDPSDGLRDDDMFSTLPFAHWNAAVHPTSSPSYPPPNSMESFQSELSTLYCEYSQCVARLTSMPSSSDGPEIAQQEHAHSAPANSPDHLDARIEYAMSKQQLQMTLDEGRIWNFFSTGSPSVPPPETESALMRLAERSTAISQSYQRRINFPTTQTYEECKELLGAMGVPCIETSGPFEAEALACALVTHGHADFVVSEDTDVLVYEAPMLRGITPRESPVVVVHGDAVRETLELDRASYIDFALLLGTDFSQRIKNVGPNRALKFIKEHGSIERVVEQESQYVPRVAVADYLAQVDVARHVFQNLPPLPDVRLLHQTEGDPDAVLDIIRRYKLQRVLASGWNPESALAGNYFGDDPSVW